MQRVTPFRSAGIILSYTCSSRCRHCLYNCSNQWSGWMETDLLEAIYRGTRACVGQVRGFHLAGGEAFLNFPVLLDAVQRATAHGIPLDYVETNAHWFTSADDATAKLTALREAGLDCLLISVSPFHLEYVPFEKTRGAIQASLAVFGRAGTFIWLPEFLQEMAGRHTAGTLPFEAYAAMVGEHGAREAARYGGQLVPGGRSGYQLAAYLPQQPLDACLDDSCEYELLHCGYGHYDLYGNIIPCSCSGISIGDASDLPRHCAEFSLAGKPVLQALVKGGTRALYQLACADFRYQPRETYAGHCHLCVDLRRHLVAAGLDAPELAPRDYYTQI